MGNENSHRNQNYLNKIVNSLYKIAANVDWKRVYKYASLGALGAILGKVAGDYAGPEIADMVVDSKVMGLESSIAADQIKKYSPYLVGLLGLALAYIHDRKQSKK